ncbi:unnamed protein product [Candida verbasci]|uniref:Uncharacterized protein n=1 Tax=Candida verbasci TaxID=1227364 RepID=A0A9W4XA04_9ASCO|nr:unnamed protein product [Candida verbasci]
MSSLGSPCDSCLTLSSLQSQISNQYLQNYILNRLRDDFEIIITYNHSDIFIKTSSISSLISSITKSNTEITVNHLLIYLFYHSKLLFNHKYLINQFKLIHLGKNYPFQLINQSPTLESLKINQFPKLFLTINDDWEKFERSNFRYFNVESYLIRYENFKDKSTGNITYVDTIVRKLKRNNSTSSDQTIKSNDKFVKRKRMKIFKFFKRIVV